MLKALLDRYKSHLRPCVDTGQTSITSNFICNFNVDDENIYIYINKCVLRSTPENHSYSAFLLGLHVEEKRDRMV